MDDDKIERLAQERAEWGERIAAGPHVRLSANQCRLMAEYLGLGAEGWKRVSRAWGHAMANGVPVDPEHLKPPGESRLDSSEDRAALEALRERDQEPK